MEQKLRNIIDASIFKILVLECKKRNIHRELYRIGKNIWKEAQKDILNKIKKFEKEEKLLIITQEDKKLPHGFDYTQQEHINAKEKL